MMWLETSDKDAWPEKTLADGINHFKQKFGYRPNQILLPEGTNLTLLQAATNGITVETRKYVLPKHIFLACDPILTKEKN